MLPTLHTEQHAEILQKWSQKQVPEGPSKIICEKMF